MTHLNPAPHVLELMLDDTSDALSLERATRALERSLDENERISLLVRLETSDALRSAALLRALAGGIQALRRMHRFHRVAVVTDSNWMTLGIDFEAALLPIELRAFTRGAADRALLWVSEAPPIPDRQLHRLDHPRLNHHAATDLPILHYALRGELSAADVDAFHEETRAFRKYRLVLELGDAPRASGLAIAGPLFPVLNQALDRVDAVAIVGAKSLSAAIEASRMLSLLRARRFDDTGAAVRWVSAAELRDPQDEAAEDAVDFSRPHAYLNMLQGEWPARV